MVLGVQLLKCNIPKRIPKSVPGFGLTSHSSTMAYGQGWTSLVMN